MPLLIRSPLMNPEKRGQETDFSASLIDIVPTLLDWYGLKYPKYHILKPNQPTILTGRSLLPILSNADNDLPLEDDACFYGSHIVHEVTMNYPMRTIVLGSFKLIHNLNYRSAFPIDQDFYMSPTFQVNAVSFANHVEIIKIEKIAGYVKQDDTGPFSTLVQIP